MLAVLGQLTGPFAKYAAIAVGFELLIAGGAWIVHEHDNKVMAQVALANEHAISAQMDDDRMKPTSGAE